MSKRPALATISSSLSVGIPLAVLWAVQAAAPRLPGARVLLLPFVIVLAGGLLLWRRFTGASTPRSGLSSTTVGLVCWFIAATLSTILNWDTEQVVPTYIVVFLAGGAIFVALSGYECTTAALEIGIVGLALGALLPLVGGLLAFGVEWGSPDMATVIQAWQNIVRMNSYTEATFGNRGNTAGFIVILAPILIAVLVDQRKRPALRAFCAAVMVPVALNLMILQVRAAFITLVLALAVAWTFKRGARRLPLMLAGLALCVLIAFKLQPDAGEQMTDRIVAAVTVDTAGDESVQGRLDAIEEGARIFGRNWLLGVGPGGALTRHSFASAHQFHVQEAMETGILGLIGTLLMSAGVLISLLRTMARGSRDEVNDIRFTLLIGPASFLIYAIMANAALNNGNVNTWTILTASMLALVPAFVPVAAPARVAARVGTRRPAAALRVPAEAQAG